MAAMLIQALKSYKVGSYPDKHKKCNEADSDAMGRISNCRGVKTLIFKREIVFKKNCWPLKLVAPKVTIIQIRESIVFQIDLCSIALVNLWYNPEVESFFL